MAKKQTSEMGATSKIGDQLRLLYKSVEQEPIPDKFLDLLEKLDEAEAAAGEPTQPSDPSKETK